MTIQMDEERRTALLTRIRSWFREEFDEELSEFRAAALLDFFTEALGPQIYNQAVQDARAFMLQRLEDLEGDVYEPER
jgi:uncharacterized protein (DUF2164 family)